jgi:Mitochondrial carrier protein.
METDHHNTALTHSVVLGSPNPKQRSDFQQIGISFLGGCIAGIANVLISHPFDTIKVRMQMLNVKFLDGFKLMVQREGLTSLFKGVASPLYNIPFMNALYFGSYEIGRWAQGVGFHEKITWQQSMIAGIFSGIPACLILTPAELIKCRLQMEGVGSRSKRTNALTMFRTILKNEGIAGLYKGNLITLFREVPCGAFFFGTYEVTKSLIDEYYGQTYFAPFISGGAAGLVSTIVCYPQDVIKTKIQCDGNSPISQKYPNHKFFRDGGIISCMKDIYKTDGWHGFCRGFSASAIRSIISEAVTFLVYVEGKKVLGE